jgi:YYY domain-containing protein
MRLAGVIVSGTLRAGKKMRVMEIRRRWPLLALFGLALFVRLFGINWDQRHFFHPDERAIAMAVERLSFVPPQLNPHFFAYGSFPLYVTKIVTASLGNLHRWFAGYDGIIYVGRALSAVWGAATTVLLAVLGSRLYGRRAGLLAGALLGVAVLHVQSSHFAISDIPLTFLVLLTLYFLALVAESGELRHYLAAGAAVGLGVATKFSALPILLPLAIAVFSRWRKEKSNRPLLRGAIAVGAAAAAFGIGQPYAILDFRAYFHDILEQSRMVRNAGIFPYTNQYIGVPKYLYDLGQMVLWGMGPLLALAALWGTIRCIRRVLHRPNPVEVILLSWVLPFFLITGSFDVKFLRYLLPIYPLLILWGAAWLDELWSRGRLFGRVSVVVTTAAALAGLLGFLAIYTRPHTVVSASEWLYDHVPAGTRIATQHWDEGFPFPLPDRDPGQYPNVQLPYYEPDTPSKIAGISSELAAAEYVVFPTKRVYGSVTRAPEKFPLTSRYFFEFFAGDLGYTLVEDFSSRPTLFGLEIPDELADESFTVYDHPRVLIFRNTGRLAASEIEKRIVNGAPSRPLRRSDLLRATAEPSARLLAATGAPQKPPAATAQASRSREPGVTRGTGIGSVASAAIWYLAILMIGTFALPIAHRLFPDLADRGAGFAKILSLALTTYVLAFCVKFHVLSNGSVEAWVTVLLLAVGGAFVAFRSPGIVRFWRERWRVIAVGEIVFAGGFLLFLGFRAFNPEIYWGEKPMDFSILNILVRSRTLPPSDPWFAGAPLGYYVFGQQMVAFLTLLTGLSTRYTFNLAFGLLGGAIAQGAFSLARSWGGTLRAGLTGAGFTLLLGNLAGLREWLVRKRPFDWHYFWATSRVVPDTINEYPIWSLLFADLHAHLLALPLFLLVAAGMLQYLRAHVDPAAALRRRLLSSLPLGIAIGAQALTNAWDIPLLGGLLLLTGLVAYLSDTSSSAGKRIARAAMSIAASAAVAALLVLPLWVRGGGPPGFGWNADAGARGVDVLIHYGLFFFLAIVWMAATTSEALSRGARMRRLRAVPYLAGAVLLAVGFVSVEVFCIAAILLFVVAIFGILERPEDRLSSGMIAAAFFLVLFAQKAYISDRMNTFFKLYFEAWPLLALSTAVLVFGSAARVGSFERWPAILRIVFVVLLAAALFTSVTIVRGALFAPGNPSRPENRVRLTLDGMRYLESWKPGEHAAVEWLRRAIPGTPVLLEAQGASYQGFSRISMLTGIPTVLGWEHHVKQRGNPESEVETRRADIERIFSSSDTRGVSETLRKYHVGYVYVGALERQTYPTEGLRKFSSGTDLFQIAYENPDVKIYRVIGGDAEDVIVPVREVLPVAAKGPQQEEPEEAPTISDAPISEAPPFSGMKEPRDAAVDEHGRIWIADFGNSRLRIFNAEGGLLGGWGGRGSGTFGLREPCGVSISGENVYLADTWNGRIQSFTEKGEWKSTATGLFGPRGIAVSRDGRVWVTDTGNKRVVVYDGTLKELQQIGKLGSAPLEFSDPVGIAVGPSDSVYVADTGNARIQILSDKGQFERAIPVPGWNRNVEPHLEIDEDGTIYASDPQNNALVTFKPSGELDSRRAADDSNRPLARPTGVALDRKNRILYVVNSGNGTISKWNLPEKRSP